MTTKKRIGVGVILFVALVVVLLWWRSRSAPVATNERNRQGTLTTQPTANAETKKDASDAASPPVIAAPPTQKPSPELKRTFQTLNHNPIEFYGRALDQFGGPVAGAEVSGVVLYNTGTKAGEKENKTTTDAEGYFQFTNLEGQDLGVSITKDGYDYRSRNSSFSYSYFEAVHKRHIPDPKNPVVFTLWKKQGAEALVHYDIARDVPADGTPIRINLEKGKTGGAEADLVVSISRTPLRQRREVQGYEWKATVDVIDGGLVRADGQDYYNLAPESGYQPHYEYVQAAQNVREAQDGRIKWSWRGSIAETFFVTVRNGKYFARVNVEIMAKGDRDDGDNIGIVRTVVWLNPNGSRNLEFDRSKVIKVQQ